MTRNLHALGAMALAVLAACPERSTPAPPPPPTPPADAADAGLTVEQAGLLFEGAASCRIDGHVIDQNCPARLALHAATVDDASGARRRVVDVAARALLSHAAPPVRLLAFTELSVTDDETTLAAALAAERDPACAVAMIHDLPANTGWPRILEVVLARLDDPAAEVRVAALFELASPQNMGHHDLLERIASLVERDPDQRVRAEACMRLGLLRDPRSVAIHDRQLVAATPPALFESCATGLVLSWLADPENEHPVEAAYRRSLALLRDGPHRPGAPGVETLEEVYGLERTQRTFDALPAWVDVAETRAALGAFVASRRADPAARRLAAEMVVNLGAPVAELRAVRARLADRSPLAAEIRGYLTDAESWVDDPPP